MSPTVCSWGIFQVCVQGTTSCLWIVADGVGGSDSHKAHRSFLAGTNLHSKEMLRMVDVRLSNTAERQKVTAPMILQVGTGVGLAPWNRIWNWCKRESKQAAASQASNRGDNDKT